VVLRQLKTAEFCYVCKTAKRANALCIYQRLEKSFINQPLYVENNKTAVHERMSVVGDLLCETS
jgi:hypothetical protein